MIRAILIAATLVAVPSALLAGTHKHRAAPAEGVQGKHLCGWIANPTPGNWWLNDRHGEWIIGLQGGAMAKGDLPDFDKGPQFWVKMQANGYGYGCACIEATVDPVTHIVSHIYKTEVRELNVCRDDKNISEPKG